MGIDVASIRKAFGGQPVLDDVTVSVQRGQLVALLGPSGCGKTTLLRIIAGLEQADSGSVLYAGENVTSKSARERNVGVVFQHYALFPHMTVEQNVGFALRIRRLPRPEVAQRVGALLRLVQLEEHRRRYPGQLSGGQRQRVALARALASEPRVLLLDEPFGALDARVRQQLRRWLRRLHDEIHVTTIFVTHDREEAFEVADRIVLLNRGRVEQVGTPTEIYEEPASSFVMRFLGTVNVLPGRVEDGCPRIGEPDRASGGSTAAVYLYARPHEIDVHTAPVPDGIAAMVRRVTPVGARLRLELAIPSLESPLSAEIGFDPSEAFALRAGAQVFVSPRYLRWFPGEDPPDSLTASAL